MRFFAVLAALLLVATPAAADPFSAALAALKAGGFKAFAATAFGGFLVRTAASFALSLLSQAIAGKQEPSASGTQIPGTTVGEDKSQSFVLGLRATGGHLVYRNSHSNGGTPNGHLTEVIEVSDIGPVTLEGLIIGDRVCPISETEHSEYGFELDEYRGADGSARAWIKWYDGTQTTADAYLVDRYGDDDGYEWSAQHIGTGTAYAILTYWYDREVFQSQPSVTFIVGGIPLYDPRKDTSVGGSGAHRCNDPDTWEPSANAAVQVYNLMRGIPMPTGEIYGGRVAAGDLPLANWVAGMNVCDAMIGDRIQFQTCTEVRVAEVEPADIIETLLRGALGQIAEVGGVWRCRFGAPAAPVYSFTDDDISISDPQTFDPIKGLESTFNATVATYIEPAQLWQPRTTDVLRNATWEAEDGGRLLIADVQIGAVASLAQAEQVKAALITDERRQRQHGLVLPPDAMLLDPLDDVQWTSARNGYDDKDFEVAGTLFRTASGMMEVTLRERDPDDYDWTAGDDPNAVAAYVPTPLRPAQLVPGFAVNGYSIEDDDSEARRPALKLTWDADGMVDVFLLRWQVRNAATQAVVAQGVEPIEEEEKIVVDGIVAGVGYEARAQLVVARPTEWTSWLGAVAPDVRLTQADLADTLQQRIDTAFDRHDEVLAEAEGTIGDLRDRIQEWLGGIGLDPTGPLQPLKPLDRTVALEIPRIRSVQDAAIEAEDNAILNAIENFGLRRRLTDAGVYVDPETGSVKIRAIDAISGRQSTVEIRTEALESEIGLRATFADVNQAISAAVLDPSQIPLLDDLEARVSDAEIILNAQDGEITSITNALTVEDGIVTMANVTQRLSSVEGNWALTLTQQTFEELQTTANEVSVELETLDKPGIAFSVSTSRALRDQSGLDDDARVIDMIRSWQDTQGAREVAAIARRNLTAFIDDNNNTIAQEVAELAAIGQDTSAQLRQESTVRAEADAATVEQLSELEARVDDPETGLAAAIGQINDLNTLDVTSESALVVDYLSLKGQVNDPETGLPTAIGELEQLNNVSVTSTSALVEAHLTLQAQVSDPETGLPAAIGEIEQLNNVDVTSTSALVQAHRSLAADVNTPGTGLKARLDDLDEIVVDEDGIRGIFGQELTGSLAPNGELRDEIDTAADNAVGAAVGRVATFDIDPTSALAIFRDEAAAALDDGEGNILGANVLSGAIATVEDNEQGLSALSARADILESGLGASNLIPNGRVDTGDYSRWGYPQPGNDGVVPSTFSVGVRGAGPVILNLSPTPFAIRIAADAATQTATAADVPVTEGDVIRLSARAARGSTGSGTIRLQAVFDNADGGLAGVVARTITPTNSWVLYGDLNPIEAPAGSARMRVRLIRDGGGSGDFFVTDFRAERDAAGVVDVAARVSTIEGAYVDEAGALAFVNQQISAEYGDITALAEATSFAEATLDGISEGFVWSLGGDDVLSLVRVDDGVTAPTTTARIASDLIRLDGDTEVTGSFIVSGANVILNADTQVNGDFRVNGNLVVEGTVDTEQMSTNAITNFVTAGSGTVLNNSSNPTVVHNLTLPTDGVSAQVIGQLTLSLTEPHSSYPSGFRIDIFVNGVLSNRADSDFFTTEPSRRVIMPIARPNVSGNPVTVRAEIVNAGGFGVIAASIWAGAFKK